MPSDLITIERPAPPAVVAELSPLVAAARSFSVTDVETNAQALENVRRLRRGEKAIEDHFADAKKKASDAHRSIVAAVNGLTGPIAEARSIYDRKAADYEAEQRRLAEVEQRRLQEEARKQEEERALMDAIEAESAGDAAGAEAILAQPVAVPVVHVAPQVAKVEGVSSRETWSAEVENVVTCLRFMTDRPEWHAALERLKPDLETMLRPFAVSQRQALAIPGVKAVSRVVRATR